jgi:ferredoxin
LIGKYAGVVVYLLRISKCLSRVGTAFPLDSEKKIETYFSMAEKDEKWPENVKGKYYVDEQCIDCDLCRETAPNFFTRNEDGGYSFVHKQPESQEDIDLCMEALEGCPVEAIGEDGDED